MFKRKHTYFYCYMVEGEGVLNLKNGFVTMTNRLNTLDRYAKVKESIAKDIEMSADKVVIISLHKV